MGEWGSAQQQGTYAPDTHGDGAHDDAGYAPLQLDELHGEPPGNESLDEEGYTPFEPDGRLLESEPTIAQRLTRGRMPRADGPPAMAVDDANPAGGPFCIYLCSGPRRTADLAEQLGVLGKISTVLVDPTLQEERREG